MAIIATSGVLPSYAKQTSYAFVNYTDMDSMHDTSTYTQIRKHAMKQVGAAKRKPRVRSNPTIELFWVPAECKQRGLVNIDPSRGLIDRVKQLNASERTQRVADDKALYDTFIHSISGKMDPFDAASIKLDATSLDLLQYFIFHASRFPNTWTYSSSPLLPSTPKEHRESIFRTIGSALRDPLLGNCLLATATARLCYCCYTEDSSEKYGSPRRIKQKDLALTTRALHLLRDRLDEVKNENASREVIETLVASMLHLGGAAFYREDVAAANTHIEAAITLARRIGGVHAISDPYVRGRIISFDDLISCVEIKPCLVVDKQNPELDERIRHRHSLADSNDSLEAWNFPAMSPSLRALIIEILDFQRDRQAKTTLNKSSMFEMLAHRQRSTLRVLSIRRKLLAAKLIALRANVLRIAVLMWTLLPPQPRLMERATIVHALAPKLRHLLLELDLNCIGCKDIRLWCLLMGYCCAPAESKLAAWFAGEVRRQLRSLGGAIPKGYDHLVDFQKQFLYFEPIQRPATERLTRWLLQGEQS